LKPWAFGDVVKGRTWEGVDFKGRVVGIDYGPGDSIRAIAVQDAQHRTYDANPSTLRYVTGREGFAFEFTGDVLLVHRNDTRMSDPRWWRRRGAKKLYQALRYGTDPRRAR
jgi:hypothetical protein